MAKKFYPGNYHSASDRGQAIPSSRVSFEILANACLARAERLVAAWLPEGRREGQEWVALNPTRADSHVGSFKVNLVTGQWADFATGDKGGDLISLYGYLYGLKNGQAATRLVETLGLVDNPPAGTAGARRQPSTWTPLTPVPADAPPAPVAHPKHGRPSAVWTYRDAAERILFHVYRFDLPNGKQLLPLTYCRNPSGQHAWRWQGLDAPRPLYNLHLLAARPDDWVLIPEGEKATEAGGILFPDYVPTTSPGGSQAADKADWTPLKGRQCAIWADNDAAGRHYAATVAHRLRAVGAACVRELSLEAGYLGCKPILVDGKPAFEARAEPLPEGWDAADALAEGWTVEHIQRLRTDPGFWLPPPEEQAATVAESQATAKQAAQKPKRAERKQQWLNSFAGTGGQVTNPTPEDNWPRLTENDKPPHIDTDQANGYRLARNIGQDLLYVINMGWHAWIGTYWQRGDEYAYHKAAILSRLILADAADYARQASQCEEVDRRNALSSISDRLIAWAHRSESYGKVEAAMAFARTLLAVESSELNQAHWLLTCQNGTLDLQTGMLRPHRRDDFSTKAIPVAYDPTAPCPRWLAFLDRIFANNAALLRFLQKAAGYALTGDTSEQCVFILWGGGKNGKSTLLKTLQTLLGTYAQQAAPDLLVASKQDRHPTEIAKLHGARLVVSIETGEGRRLNEPLIKQMSGGDKMCARFMRQDFFEFDPTHKVFLATNHKPVIRGTDYAIWRRIRLIPFTVTIPESECDVQLPEKLQAELPGVLAWCVQGCLAWQREGLKPPQEVVEATESYRSEMDVLALFLSECCVIDKRADVAKASLYQAYMDWCSCNNERPETQRQFSKRIQERGFSEGRTGHKGERMWIGLGLAADTADVADVKSSITPREYNLPKDHTENSVSNVSNVSTRHESPPETLVEYAIGDFPPKGQKRSEGQKFQPAAAGSANRAICSSIGGEAHLSSTPVTFHCQACRHYSALAHSCGDSSLYVENTDDPLCRGRWFQPLWGDDEERI